MLKIKFLGELKIQLDQKDITDKISSKGAAILAILMMQKNKQITRRKLLGFLWPKSTDDAAKYNLRYNLWQLKKLLTDTETGEPFLIVSKDFCKINRRYAYVCDLCDVAEADIEHIQSPARLEELRELLSRGFFENQYFSGCDEFEEMIIMQRYSLENKKLHLLKKMIEIYYNGKQDEKCLKALQDCEELDPYDETNAEKRIRLLIKSGDCDGAIGYYRRFCSRLALDIGMESPDSLKKLAGKIQTGSEKNSGVYHVEAVCLKSVDCYFMAGVLKGLSQIKELHFTDYLSPGEMADLSYLCREFSKLPQKTSMARVVDSFLTLITGICGNQKSIEIKIENYESIDPISGEVLELLRKKCGTQLVII